MMLLLFSIFFIACQRDSCELFCEELGRDIRYCINNGSLEWQDFEATSENEFSQNCVDEWTLMRTQIEPRVLEDIEQQCDAGADSLQKECDLLMALYLVRW